LILEVNFMGLFLKIISQRTLEYLFYLFVFLLPWQTRWIFRDYQIDGEIFEYGRMSLYGFDIIFIVLLFCCFIFGKRQVTITNEQQLRRNEKLLIALILLVVYALAAITWSNEKLLAIYWIGRLALGAGLFWAVQKINFSKLKLALVAVVVGFIQALLAVWQFAGQDIWSNKWLGMASQRAGELGASVVGVGEERWLRAYGSWPHPNILGGFLVLVCFFWFYLLVSARERQQRRFILLTGSMIVAGIFFSFSRASWLVSLMIYIGAWIYTLKYRLGGVFKKGLMMLGLVGAVLLILFWPLVGTRLGVGEAQRLENKSNFERAGGYLEAVELLKNNWQGTGMGNYVFALKDYNRITDPWAAQPVHNTFLMVLVELGLAGAGVLFYLNYYIIKLLVKNKKWFTLAGLAMIYSLMFFDHFWWTTASGLYGWCLAMGLGWKNGSPTSNDK